MAGSSGYAVGGNWIGLLAEVGVDHADVLRRAALPEDLFHREESRLTPGQFLRLSNALDQSIDDPAFWVRLTEAMSAEWFTPPIFAALCSPDLITASERLARFKPLIAPVQLQVRSDANGLHLTYLWKGRGAVPAYLHAVEAMFVVKLSRLGTRHAIRPVSVEVPEIPTQTGPYESFLGVRLTRGENLRVTFSPTDARRPFLTANNAMWSIFEPELRKRLADLEGDEGFAARTRAVLLEALPSGQAAMDAVAKRLAVSSRTLQRRLREEGTTFKDVLHATRETLARHYLGQTQLTSTEIAYLLGFEEPTSFFRAFHRWTGMTPETHRQRILENRNARPSDSLPTSPTRVSRTR